MNIHIAKKIFICGYPGCEGHKPLYRKDKLVDHVMNRHHETRARAKQLVKNWLPIVWDEIDHMYHNTTAEASHQADGDHAGATTVSSGWPGPANVAGYSQMTATLNTFTTSGLSQDFQTGGFNYNQSQTLTGANVAPPERTSLRRFPDYGQTAANDSLTAGGPAQDFHAIGIDYTANQIFTGWQAPQAPDFGNAENNQFPQVSPNQPEYHTAMDNNVGSDQFGNLEDSWDFGNFTVQ